MKAEKSLGEIHEVDKLLAEKKASRLEAKGKSGNLFSFGRPFGKTDGLDIGNAGEHLDTLG